MQRRYFSLIFSLLILSLPISLYAQVQPSSSNGFLHPAGGSCEAPVGPMQTGAAHKALAGSPMVRIAYIIPSNRTPQPNGVAALQDAIVLGRQWFKAQMEQNGFEPRTFRVETEADGITPRVHVVSVAETDSVLRGAGGNDLWSRTIDAAARAGISSWVWDEVWLLVPEAHVQQTDGSIIGGVALGASNGSNNDPGIAMIGGNGLAMLGYLQDDRPYDGLVIPELGPLPLKQDISFAWFEGNTLSSVSSSWTGALMHELGHALGLPHDFRNDNNFHGNLMGNGLRGIRGNIDPIAYPGDYTRLTYAEAQYVDTSPYFNEGKPRSEPPKLAVSLPDGGVPVGGQLRLVFSASDADGLAHARLALNGDRIGEMKLSGINSSATFTTPYHLRDKESEYYLAVFDLNGNKQETKLTVKANLTENWAPQPFIQISPPMPAASQFMWLDARQSGDPDHGTSGLQVEWDLNNDGVFDTSPMHTGTPLIQSLAEGDYLVRARVTDPTGAQSISTPVSFHVRPITGNASITRVLTFEVDMNREIRLGHLPAGSVVGLRGNAAPLSWTATTPLSDPDGDGIFSSSVSMTLAPETPVYFQFVHHWSDGSELAWEYGAQGKTTRLLLFNGEAVLPLYYWNDVTGVATADEAGPPASFALHENYPNPFNPATRISFDVPRPAHVRLSVFDMLGRKAAVLVDGPMAAGRHTALFEAGGLPSGVYLYRLEANGYSETRRLLLVK